MTLKFTFTVAIFTLLFLIKSEDVSAETFIEKTNTAAETWR